MKRYAIVRGLGVSRERVQAYLPSNYKVIWEGKTDWHWHQTYALWKQIPALTEDVVVIQGEDHPSGSFGLNSYIMPRLGSGMMRADEIDLSHPLMKEIPDGP